MCAKSVDVLVVGAGVAGLACAREVASSGAKVLVLDKGRGPGGRLSTRREEVDGLSFRFDHGAQYLTARDERFAAEVNRWQSAGVVQPWNARIVDLHPGNRLSPREDPTPRYVGVPGMSAICRYLADALDVRYSLKVESFQKGTARSPSWTVTAKLEDASGSEARFDCQHLVLAIPDVQTRDLLSRAGLSLEPHTLTQPCWTVMTVLDGHQDLGFDAAFTHGSALGWIAREASKPSRAVTENAEAWVLQASPEWSRDHVEDVAPTVVPALLADFETLTGQRLTTRFAKAHRWRYAKTVTPAGKDHLQADGILLCGDWLLGGKIEAAWLSGTAAAQAVIKK